MNRRIFFILLALVGLLGLHFLAAKLYLYWTFWWFDLFMHAAGGLLTGLLSLVLFSEKKRTPVFYLLQSCFSVLFVGILWELFEYIIGFTLITVDGYVVDTVMDIALDLTGALVAYLVFTKKFLSK